MAFDCKKRNEVMDEATGKTEDQDQGRYKYNHTSAVVERNFRKVDFQTNKNVEVETVIDIRPASSSLKIRALHDNVRFKVRIPPRIPIDVNNAHQIHDTIREIKQLTLCTLTIQTITDVWVFQPNTWITLTKPCSLGLR